jgi:hypothetical protein
MVLLIDFYAFVYYLRMLIVGDNNLASESGNVDVCCVPDQHT